MELDDKTRDLLAQIDSNPYLKKTTETKDVIEQLLENDILTYGNLG